MFQELKHTRGGTELVKIKLEPQRVTRPLSADTVGEPEGGVPPGGLEGGEDARRVGRGLCKKVGKGTGTRIGPATKEQQEEGISVVAISGR